MALPFALLSMARSGGHYVRGLINSHPEVSCQGEWVNPTTDEGFDPKPQARAVGVKLDQPNMVRLPMVLPTLMQWGTRFVVLRRANQFEAARSFAQVHEGGWWRAKRGQEPPERTTVYLSASSCWERWTAYEQWEYEMVSTLPDNTVYLTYEDVVADPELELLPVWELLGVDPPLLVDSPFIKLESRPLSESVANYDELVEKFSDSPYAKYL